MNPQVAYRYSNPYNFSYPYSGGDGFSACGGPTYGTTYGKRYDACLSDKVGPCGPLSNTLAPPNGDEITAIFGGELTGSTTVTLPNYSGQAASPTFVLTSGPFGVPNNLLRLHFTYGLQGKTPVWSIYGGQIQFGA